MMIIYYFFHSRLGRLKHALSLKSCGNQGALSFIPQTFQANRVQLLHVRGPAQAGSLYPTC
jgi:hypothetical protein